ncbi:hypothetical protein [Flavihumibacter profundi]|uniref:hypothetical protein n=1 Tax=Flavihumibacter profundi TaxID=2716883 RepID=UPI001CC7451D|nr:hypothetical protein [Flavihumibacter profundi]MBZ5856586.1 hypothetical protein [Flavihumibacter profundi]
MAPGKIFYISAIGILLTCMFWAMSSCSKEYSYEARTVIDSLPSVDTLNSHDSIPVIGLEFPVCPGCDSIEKLSPYYWSFIVNKRLVCGTITATYVNYERTGITFFGPSACAIDSGLVIDAFFDAGLLNANNNNFQANRVNWQYYDNNINNQILSSWMPHVFNVTIDSYSHETGIAVGGFKGYAKMLMGDSVAVSDGRFRILLEK